MAALQPSAESRWRFDVRILGPFELYRDSVRLPTERWQKRVGRLFKLLVTAPDHRVSRDDLVETLWPETSPQAGVSNLRLLVHLLRHVLTSQETSTDSDSLRSGRHGARPTQSPAVVTQGGWVALNPAWVWELDLDRFERLARSDERQARAEAASLYRGEPLPEDRYDDWASPVRERIQRTWRTLCLGLAHQDTRDGSLPRAVQWVERVLESDPLDEEAVRELMGLLGQLRRRAEALQRYRQFERRLDEELDLRPAPETFAVVADLRASAGHPDGTGSPSPPASRIDLGKHIVPMTPSYPFPSSRALVGREAQLERMLHALAARNAPATEDQDHASRPLLFLIEAEAGAGKSTVLGELARRVRHQGTLTLAGGCYEQEGRLPYGPIHDALLDYIRAQPRLVLDGQLAQFVPDLLRIVPEARDNVAEPVAVSSKIEVGESERLRLFSAIARVFEGISADKPLLLLLDDLHWADDATLQLLHFLLRQATLSRLSIVGAYRDEEIADGTGLAQLALELKHTNPSRILTLSPLGEEDLTVLLEDRIGGRCSERLAKAIHSRSAGNPFFAVQITRLLQQEHHIRPGEGGWDLHAGADFDLPEAVRDAVARQLQRFDRVEREALTLAAVLGREFTYPALESMWQGTEDDLFAALDGAVGSQVLSESESGYVFRHPLLWEVVYQRIPTHRRPSLHRRAALVLETVYGDQAEVHAAELAWHARVAGDKQRTLRYSLRAGDRAAAAFAHEEAEQQYETALDVARQLHDITAEGAALEGLGRLLTIVGRFDEALELLERAAGIWRETDQINRTARSVALIGWIYHFNGMRDTGWARVQSFLDAAGHQLAPDTLAALHVVLSNLLVDEWTEEHLRVATQASHYARLAGHSELLAEAEVTRVVVLASLGRNDEALRALERAMPLAEEARDLFALVRALHTSSGVHLQLGEFDAAWLRAERGLELARREGHALQITALTDDLATIAFHTGDWDLAQQLWQEAVPIARSLGPSRASAEPFLGIGRLYLHQGRDEEAAQNLAECIALANAARSPDTVRAANVALAEQDLVNGNPRAALDRVAAFSDESNAETYRAYSLLTVLARAYLALGDTTRAEEIVRRGLERATAHRERLGAARMLWVHGAILARQGRCPQAERALNEAAAAARELSYPFVEALALTELGTGSLEREQWRPGRERLTAALAIFQRLQARPYIERTRQALEQFTPAATEADVQARQ